MHVTTRVDLRLGSFVYKTTNETCKLIIITKELAVAPDIGFLPLNPGRNGFGSVGLRGRKKTGEPSEKPSEQIREATTNLPKLICCPTFLFASQGIPSHECA